MHNRTVLLTLLVAVVAAACGPDTSTSDRDDVADATRDSSDATATAPEAQPAPGTSARPPIRATSTGCTPGEFPFDQPDCLPAHSIPLEAIISGGPPPDGIPPIDDPAFESIEQAATWLEPQSPVMVVDVDGEVRAYPLAILTWHEIVNDEVGGRPLVVTYCPLCNSALAFDRRITGDDDDVTVLDFGTSGRLYQSNLVMYDRQTRNLWTQFDGEAVVGEPYLGTRLERVPAWMFGFEQFAELHPDAVVLSRDTGHNRDYGRNPYTGYDTTDRDPFAYQGPVDDRFPPMTRVVGVSIDGHSVAVLTGRLVDERVTTIKVGDRELVVLWEPGQASALDRQAIDEGRDVGQTAVHDATGEELEIIVDGTHFVDATSGSALDLRGRFTGGQRDGQQLEPVPHDDTFWFVWVAFRPDTIVAS